MLSYILYFRVLYCILLESVTLDTFRDSHAAAQTADTVVGSASDRDAWFDPTLLEFEDLMDLRVTAARATICSMATAASTFCLVDWATIASCGISTTP